MPRFYVVVGGGDPGETIVFDVEAESESDREALYVAYAQSEEMTDYWQRWADRTKYPLGDFVNRFGYKKVDVGNLQGDSHLLNVLARSGINVERKRNKEKSLEWVEIATKNFASNAPSIDLKSLNYTKPELRERLKRQIMAGSDGGKPGQWSARKAQLLALRYRKAGGGYRGGLRKTQRSLRKWTREKWTTSDGKPAIRSGGTRRYLPASAWSKLTPAQRAATNRKKIAGSRRGDQFVRNTEAAERAGRRARKN